MNNLIDSTIAFVKEELRDAEGGHDWFHVERVYKNALQINKSEKGDEIVVSLGALLHDIADSKFHQGDETIGPQKARKFLESQGLEKSKTNHIIKIIENISFKGGNFKSSFSSKELDILRDADRLDAIGAIGIARAFNYGGYKNRGLYDPDIPPNLNMTKEEYKKSTAPTINHFYEKLLRLKSIMVTPTAIQIAEGRELFMKNFLEEFFAEWEGKR